MEGLLKNKDLLSEDQIVAPDLVLYEVANAVWKHEHLLKDLSDGKQYLSILYGLIEAGKITVLSPNESLMQHAYSIAKTDKITVYDAISISLAIKLGLALKTFDSAQEQAMKREQTHANKPANP